MKPGYEHITLIKNEAAHRFEMDVDGQIAIIAYKEAHFKMTLLHTEVPPALEGKGAATAIIEKTLEYIEKNHYRLVPLCPMVAVYIKRHPEWKMLLDESVKNNF